MVGLFGGWIRKEEGQGDHPQKDLIVHGSHQLMPSESVVGSARKQQLGANEPFIEALANLFQFGQPRAKGISYF